MPDNVEEYNVVFHPDTGIDPKAFAAWWNETRECSEVAFAIVQTKFPGGTMGGFELVREIVELVPEGVGLVLGVAVTKAYLEEIVKRYWERRTQKDTEQEQVNREQAEASTAFRKQFLTVTPQEEHELKKTFLVRFNRK